MVNSSDPLGLLLPILAEEAKRERGRCMFAVVMGDNRGDQLEAESGLRSQRIHAKHVLRGGSREGECAREHPGAQTEIEVPRGVPQVLECAASGVELADLETAEDEPEAEPATRVAKRVVGLQTKISE